MQSRPKIGSFLVSEKLKTMSLAWSDSTSPPFSLTPSRRLEAKVQKKTPFSNAIRSFFHSETWGGSICSYQTTRTFKSGRFIPRLYFSITTQEAQDSCTTEIFHWCHCHLLHSSSLSASSNAVASIAFAQNDEERRLGFGLASWK